MAEMVLIDTDLFEEMVGRLRTDRLIFTHYGILHEAKSTREGHEKAVTNFSHANNINKLLNRLQQARKHPE